MNQGLRLQVGYGPDAGSRQALDELVKLIFDLDFAPWNQGCPDPGDYTPFTFFRADRAVANVAASPMNLVIDGTRVRAVQVGTVATDPEMRGRGLARELMGVAHDHWEKQATFFFLFANDSAFDFYRKLGYRQVGETRFTVDIPTRSSPLTGRCRPLDLERTDDLQILKRLAQRRVPVSTTMGVVDHAWLLLFHALVVHKHNLSYCEDLDAILVRTSTPEKGRLVDVIAERYLDWNDLVEAFGLAGRWTLGFTADRRTVPGIESELDAGSTLFVKGRFTLEGRQFRFPDTALA